MTDLTKLRDDVIEAVKALRCAESSPSYFAFLDRLDAALGTLRAAEEAAKRPKLRAAHNFALDINGDLLAAQPFVTAPIITARDSEWLDALLTKLPRHQVTVAHYQEYAPGVAGAGIGNAPAILVSDIEALVESGKA